MEQISRYAGRVARALFLRTDAYEDMRQAPNPLLTGLVLVVVVGVFIALVGLVGTLLEWAASPNMADVQDILYAGLTSMPWYEEQILRGPPEFADSLKRIYEGVWTVLRQFAIPNPGSALGNIILTPLGLVVSWLVYGLLAHLFARLLKGEAILAQTLGCTALAVAPQILRAAEVFPFVSVGGVVGTWALICRYVALKQAHRLSWGRALWATLLPFLVLGLLGLILAAVGFAVFGALASQFLGGGI